VTIEGNWPDGSTARSAFPAGEITAKFLNCFYRPKPCYLFTWKIGPRGNGVLFLWLEGSEAEADLKGTPLMIGKNPDFSQIKPEPKKPFIGI